MDQPLLRIDDLAVSFPAGEDADSAGRIRTRRRVRAVNGVSLSVYPRQTLAVVGESGCGKSVTALSILKLVPTPPGSYDAGSIWWNQTDLLTRNEKQMRAIRGAQIAMIFQEPMTSLNPVYTIGEQILEAVLLHQNVPRREALAIAEAALVDVGIADPGSRLKEYPHQLSGGMRQRVMIAMALACQPRLLLADEPTTALDVTIQAQILELLRELQTRKGMSVLLITHDLGVVAENADVVAVMYAGRVVEYGSVVDVFQTPLHPYTRGLFNSMPVLGRQHRRLEAIPGNVPNPVAFPPGCPFHPRCARTREVAAEEGQGPRAKGQGEEKAEGRGQKAESATVEITVDGKPARVMRNCTTDEPPLLEVHEKHWAACWHTAGHGEGKKTRPDVAYRRETVAVG